MTALPESWEREALLRALGPLLRACTDAGIDVDGGRDGTMPLDTNAHLQEAIHWCGTLYGKHLAGTLEAWFYTEGTP